MVVLLLHILSLCPTLTVAQLCSKSSDCHDNIKSFCCDGICCHIRDYVHNRHNTSRYTAQCNMQVQGRSNDVMPTLTLKVLLRTWALVSRRSRSSSSSSPSSYSCSSWKSAAPASRSRLRENKCNRHNNNSSSSHDRSHRRSTRGGTQSRGRHTWPRLPPPPAAATATAVACLRSNRLMVADVNSNRDKCPVVNNSSVHQPRRQLLLRRSRHRRRLRLRRRRRWPLRRPMRRPWDRTGQSLRRLRITIQTCNAILVC